MLYHVRTMREDDIPQVTHLEEVLFSDSWSQSSIMSSLAQENVKMVVAVLDENEGNVILGYHIFYTSFEEGDVARIAVSPEYRRVGIADALLSYMWEYGLKKGIERVLLEVRESNKNAIALYQKHGFVELGLRKNYYKEPLEHGLIMEKKLDITSRI